MNRRRALLRLPAAAAALLLLSGHTPYGQWVVYRRKHLLIGCHKADPRTYHLAKAVVAVLGAHLPAAKSRVARAPDAERLASLLATAQLETAVLARADADAISHGRGRFAAYGETALRALSPVGARLLVARAGFRERHAWLVTAALADSGLETGSARAGEPDIPWHPGSLAFLAGKPQPEDGG